MTHPDPEAVVTAAIEWWAKRNHADVAALYQDCADEIRDALRDAGHDPNDREFSEFRMLTETLSDAAFEKPNWYLPPPPPMPKPKPKPKTAPICAAAVYTEGGTFMGESHADIWASEPFIESGAMNFTCGFVDADGNFLNRVQAYHRAVEHGQIKDDGGVPLLTSEMLKPETNNQPCDERR